jgi:hypothetical protein
MIRDAVATDLDSIAALAEERRIDYELAQPHFWRRAPDGIEQHRPWLNHLIESDDVISLVAMDDLSEFAGFLFATLVTAPPVYAPGGPLGLIDDFALSDRALWPTIGDELLTAAKADLASRGATQVVVVCGAHDEAKRAVLREGSMTVASEWYVQPL